MEDFGSRNSFLCNIYIFFFLPRPRYAYFFHKGRHLLIKLAVRLCVRQIVTEPIICHSYHQECSHEDYKQKRSHFVCKEKGTALPQDLRSSDSHSPEGRHSEQQRSYGGRGNINNEDRLCKQFHRRGFTLKLKQAC